MNFFLRNYFNAFFDEFFGQVTIVTIDNKRQLDQCKTPSDGILIGSGTLDGDLAGITI